MAEYIFDKFTDGTDTYKIDYSRIPYGIINSGSTSTVFNATVEGITELSNGVCAVIKNGIVTSASGCTLNVNNLGAKPIYSSMADATRVTTTFNKNYTALFIYNTIRVSTGCWDMYYGYYTNSTYSNASLGQGYGTCSTAGDTTTKAVTLSSYALTTGGVVVVSFTNAVPAGSSLNINSKGAKPIYYKGSAITGGIIEAGDRATFIYSGSYYHLLAIDRIIEAKYFKYIKANDSTISANSNTACLEFVGGNNVTVSAELASGTHYPTLTINATDTTYSEATTSAAGLMSSADKTKLDGITSGAQPNQNAFSTVKVSNTNVQANSTTDTLELEAGTNISLTPDTTNKKITIASTVVNTDSKVSTANVINNTTYYPVVGSNTTDAESKYYDSNGFKYTGTQGTASAVGSAKLELGNSTSSGTANNKEGQLVLYGSGANATTIKAGVTTAARTITFPNKNGTVALTGDYVPVSDIPIHAIVQNSEFNSRVTDGVVAGFVGMALDYVTPQMFDENIILNDETYDCTDAIQNALNTSKRVYFPEGVYYISRPLSISNHAHLWGIIGSSKIRVMPTNTFATTDFMAKIVIPNSILGLENLGQSQFLIENLEFDCNDKSVNGIYLERPYNNCVVKNTIVNNCVQIGIKVGDTTTYEIGVNTNDTRSQTLVIDNCMFLGSSKVTPISPLGYFYNCFELNLKDSKFMYKSAKKPSDTNVFCLELDWCYDSYIRGCSFAHNDGGGVYVHGKSRYFRIIGNTYENITAYPIKCTGTSENPVQQGIIIETTYYNVNRNLSLEYTTNMVIIGSFTASTTMMDTMYHNNNNIYLPTLNNGGTLMTNNNVIDLLTQNVSLGQVNGEYSVTTTANTNVQPWGCIGTQSIATAISEYGKPIGATVEITANSNPASVCINGNNLVVYSRTAGTFTVRVEFPSVVIGISST